MRPVPQQHPNVNPAQLQRGVTLSHAEWSRGLPLSELIYGCIWSVSHFSVHLQVAGIIGKLRKSRAESKKHFYYSTTTTGLDGLFQRLPATRLQQQRGLDA